MSMSHAVRQAIRGCLLIGLLLAWPPPAVHAATIPVVCPPGSLGTINLQGLVNPGDVVILSGVCTLNLVFPTSVSSVTFEGPATLAAADPTSAVVTIRGTGILIKGFTITGGAGGILVNQGGSAIIDGNVIEAGAGAGVQIQRGSTAVVINNTIRNSTTDVGVRVSENASARIGFSSTVDAAASPNVIENNAGGGVAATRSSSARVAGNTIRNNTGDGVGVDRLSQADISDNAIDGNTGHGVSVARNSGVNLGRDTGTGFLDAPNRTTVPNGGNDVNCTLNSYADGRLGTLAGTASAKSFAASCVDSLI